VNCGAHLPKIRDSTRMGNNNEHEIHHAPERVLRDAAIFESVVLLVVYFTTDAIASQLMAASPNLPLAALYATNGTPTNHVKSPAGISIRADRSSKAEHHGGGF